MEEIHLKLGERSSMKKRYVPKHFEKDSMKVAQVQEEGKGTICMSKLLRGLNR